MNEFQYIAPKVQGDLVCDSGPDLERIVRDLADPILRRAHYKAETERRDLVEQVVNAFEERREACPIDVTGPLNGLPISVKDQVAVAGWRRSFGQEKRTKRPDRESALLVKRLEDLGAVVTGKTALPPNAMDFQTGNARRGPTCNPHDPRFTTGGSTGGGAAAVASGMSILDVGADLAGSLRVPAAWCGVCSYVPTEGFWFNDGLLRGSQRLSHFARIGLTARSARDLAYIWHVLEPSAETKSEKASPVRLAIWSAGSHAPCDSNTAYAWRAFSQVLHDAPCDPEPADMDSLFEDSVYQLGGEMIGHMTGALLPALIRWMLRRDRRAAESSPGFVSHVHTGYKRDKARHQTNLQRMRTLRDAAAQDWAEYDALLLPVTSVSAFEHMRPAKDWNGVRTYEQQFNTGAGPLGYFDAMTRFTLPLTVLGWPVVTLPIGRDSNGLPVGAQLVGKPRDDGRLLAIAEQIQAALH
ncbi:amidase [Cognatiyoonia sp. IB215182]|uniref:amidase n=1 Tax=Cognatiyoonia sp. IB215182 TaxID=3097353 RepID=UPI002A1308A1|nr:amidase [Cognatiyoonia sp. IB215182]MDX8355340.1 amidase [Cognatiyoonia sp. IB215182]